MSQRMTSICVRLLALLGLTAFIWIAGCGTGGGLGLSDQIAPPPAPYPPQNYLPVPTPPPQPVSTLSSCTATGIPSQVTFVYEQGIDGQVSLVSMPSPITLMISGVGGNGGNPASQLAAVTINGMTLSGLDTTDSSVNHLINGLQLPPPGQPGNFTLNYNFQLTDPTDGQSVSCQATEQVLAREIVPPAPVPTPVPAPSCTVSVSPATVTAGQPITVSVTPINGQVTSIAVNGVTISGDTYVPTASGTAVATVSGPTGTNTCTSNAFTMNDACQGLTMTRYMNCCANGTSSCVAQHWISISPSGGQCTASSSIFNAQPITPTPGSFTFIPASPSTGNQNETVTISPGTVHVTAHNYAGQFDFTCN